MWYQLKSYIKFLLKSKNQHGVHSPFVYELVANCFYDKSNYEDYSQLKSYRDSLLKNLKFLNITDFGSGSRVFKSKHRSVQSIAKNSGTTLKHSKLLYRLVTYLNANQILELGTSLGIATHAMALANQKAKITTLEGCPETFKFTRQQLKDFNIQNVSQINGTFSEVIPNIEQRQWNLIFFDGHHSKEATLEYFEALIPKTHNNSLLIFDDIYWSKDMTEAWDIIKQHPKVTVTIDSFFYGFAFFRSEQAKENFIIRL